MTIQRDPAHAKKTVEIEHTPEKLIAKLEEVLAAMKSRRGVFSRMVIEVSGDDIKRFEVTESYLMSSL